MFCLPVIGSIYGFHLLIERLLIHFSIHHGFYFIFPEATFAFHQIILRLAAYCPCFTYTQQNWP